MLTEIGDEIFPNGIFLFNITKLQKYINDTPGQFPVQSADIKMFHRFCVENLDEETVKNANLERPVLIGEISPGKFNVIDGNHRVEKARRSGIANLPGIFVKPATFTHFLTTQSGYEAFIRYWNEKVAAIHG